MGNIKSLRMASVAFFGIVFVIALWAMSGQFGINTRDKEPEPDKGDYNLPGEIVNLDISPDKKRLAVMVDGYGVQLFRIGAPQPSITFPESKRSYGIKFSYDGKLLISSRLKVWNSSNGKLIFNAPFKLEPIQGKKSISSSRRDNKVKRDDWSHVVLSTDLSRNNKYLAAGRYGGVIEIWNLSTKDRLFFSQPQKNPVTFVAFSPDGTLLASGYENGSIALQRVRDGKLIKSWRSRGKHISSISFYSPTRLCTFAERSGIIETWQVPNGKPIHVKAGRTAQQVSALSADGRRLVCGQLNCGQPRCWGEIIVQETTTGKRLYKFEPVLSPEAVAFSRDSRMLAVGGIEYDQKFKNGFRNAVHIWHLN